MQTCEPAADEAWERALPHLDEAMAELKEPDRSALKRAVKQSLQAFAAAVPRNRICIAQTASNTASALPRFWNTRSV